MVFWLVSLGVGIGLIFGAYEMGLKSGIGIGLGYKLVLGWVLLWAGGVKCLIHYCIVLAWGN